MAVRRITRHAEPWARPWWPSDPLDPARAVVAYGALADELTVGFDGPPGGVVVPLAPPASDVALLVDPVTGEIVGAQVDNLRFKATERRPAWRQLAEPHPSPAIVRAFISQVADLLAQHGLAAENPGPSPRT